MRYMSLHNIGTCVAVLEKALPLGNLGFKSACTACLHSDTVNLKRPKSIWFHVPDMNWFSKHGGAGPIDVNPLAADVASTLPNLSLALRHRPSGSSLQTRRPVKCGSCPQKVPV